jgi:hypothetical protein
MFKKIVLGSVDLSDVSDDFKWYTLVTQFNYEEKVLENIKDGLIATNQQDLVCDCFVPIKYKKETNLLADGTTSDRIRKTKGAFSNYIFIKCKLTETLWNMFRTTTGVAVIPTVGGIPVSVTEDEINRIKEIQKAEGFSNEELKCLRKKENEKYSILRKEK